MSSNKKFVKSNLLLQTTQGHMRMTASATSPHQLLSSTKNQIKTKSSDSKKLFMHNFGSSHRSQIKNSHISLKTKSDVLLPTEQMDGGALSARDRSTKEYLVDERNTESFQ